MKCKVVVKAVIFNDAGQVLLLRRSPTDTRRPGEQDFPGGGVDPGEDLTEAVSREIQEEAGLDVPCSDLRVLYAHTEMVGGDSVTRVLYWARVKKPDVILSFEHDDFHWLTPERALIEFPHPVYSKGLEHGLKHKLFDV